MATGSGAGGATALAQAAKQSKKEIAASIEGQEENEKLRAQGEASLEQRQIAEQSRIEGIQMSQAEKVQTADVQGKQFVFNQTETRENAKIDRTAAELDNARMMQAQAAADGTSALTGMIGGITSSLANSYE